MSTTHPRIVSETAAAVPGSGIREIVNLSNGRPDTVHLEIGEPDFPTPAHVVAAIDEATRVANRYTPSAGTPELRSALARRLSGRYHLDVDLDDVVVGQGAVQCLDAVLTAMIEPGDEVLVPDPAWPNYEMQTLLHGGHPVRYRARPENDFVPDVDEVRALITRRTKVLIVNSPSNPTGATYPREVLTELVAAATAAGVTVVSDEVYDEILFAGEHVNVASIDPEHVVSVFSFSKTYAMTGSRVGYLVGPSWLVPTIARLQEPLLSSISAGSQAGALAALLGPQEPVRAMVATYRQRRDRVIGILESAGLPVVHPSGAFYLMLPLAPGVDSRAAARDLVGHGVATAPGTAFGDTARSFLRLSLASSLDDLTLGIERILHWHRATRGGARR